MENHYVLFEHMFKNTFPLRFQKTAASTILFSSIWHGAAEGQNVTQGFTKGFTKQARNITCDISRFFLEKTRNNTEVKNHYAVCEKNLKQYIPITFSKKKLQR